MSLMDSILGLYDMMKMILEKRGKRKEILNI